MRSLLQILWPAFMGASLLELLVFAHVDPADIHTLAGAPVELPRQAVYTLTFFALWAVIAASTAVSAWLHRRGGRGWDDSRPG